MQNWRKLDLLLKLYFRLWKNINYTLILSGLHSMLVDLFLFSYLITSINPLDTLTYLKFGFEYSLILFFFQVQLSTGDSS